MSNKGSDTPKPEGEAPKEGAQQPGARASGGGLGGWLPLIVTILLMPVLAYLTTTFVIVPKVMHAREAEAEGGAEGEKGEGKEPGGGAHKDPKEEKDPKEPKDGKESGGHGKEGKEGKEPSGRKPSRGKKQTVTFSKMVVNVAGSGGTRYLMSTATLVGSGGSFKETIEENKDQLLDLAIGTLGSKSITDLEKPGSRNQIRAELISLFNNALGSPVVQEIYFTEFAIQ